MPEWSSSERLLVKRHDNRVLEAAKLVAQNASSVLSQGLLERLTFLVDGVDLQALQGRIRSLACLGLLVGDKLFDLERV